MKEKMNKEETKMMKKKKKTRKEEKREKELLSSRVRSRVKQEKKDKKDKKEKIQLEMEETGCMKTSPSPLGILFDLPYSLLWR